MPSIGSWDTTGLTHAALPTCLKQGSNPDAFNTGYLPLYRGESAGGAENLAMTDMGSGYGYRTSGDCLHDGSNDRGVFGNVSMALTNASTQSDFIRAYISSIATHAYLMTYRTGDNEMAFLAIVSNKLWMRFSKSGENDTYSADLGTITGAYHTFGWSKNGGTVKVWLDGSDITATGGTYDRGSYTIANKQIGMFGAAASFQLNGFWAWNTQYANVRSNANITADHTNAATFYGLKGYADAPGTDQAFDSLVAGGGAIPVFMNQYRQRRN